MIEEAIVFRTLDAEINMLRLEKIALQKRVAELETKLKSTEVNGEWQQCNYCSGKMLADYESEKRWIERHDDACTIFNPDGSVK